MLKKLLYLLVILLLALFIGCSGSGSGSSGGGNRNDNNSNNNPNDPGTGTPIVDDSGNSSAVSQTGFTGVMNEIRYNYRGIDEQSGYLIITGYRYYNPDLYIIPGDSTLFAEIVMGMDNRTSFDKDTTFTHAADWSTVRFEVDAKVITFDKMQTVSLAGESINIADLYCMSNFTEANQQICNCEAILGRGLSCDDAKMSYFNQMKSIVVNFPAGANYVYFTDNQYGYVFRKVLLFNENAMSAVVNRWEQSKPTYP